SPVAPTSQLSSELVGGDVGSVTANAGRSHLDDVDAQVVSQLRPLGGCHLSPAVDLATEDLDVGVSRRWRVNHALIVRCRSDNEECARRDLNPHVLADTGT